MRFPVCFMLYARIREAFVLLSGRVYFLVLDIFTAPIRMDVIRLTPALYENNRFHLSVLVSDFAEKISPPIFRLSYESYTKHCAR